jgi:hypothetical protein
MAVFQGVKLNMNTVVSEVNGILKGGEQTSKKCREVKNGE